MKLNFFKKSLIVVLGLGTLFFFANRASQGLFSSIDLFFYNQYLKEDVEEILVESTASDLYEDETLEGISTESDLDEEYLDETSTESDLDEEEATDADLEEEAIDEEDSVNYSSQVGDDTVTFQKSDLINLLLIAGGAIIVIASTVVLLVIKSRKKHEVKENVMPIKKEDFNESIPNFEETKPEDVNDDNSNLE